LENRDLYLLYVDDSGAVDDKNCEHCVLAGFSVYETRTYWIDKAISDIVAAYIPSYPTIEIHASPMRSGKGEWRGIPQNIREAILMETLKLIASDRGIQLFASVIAKSKAPVLSTISDDLFSQVASRFDMFLRRIYKQSHDRNVQRGIAIFDESKEELKIQGLSHTFTNQGNQWGNRLNNFAEVPLFLNSKMSRLIQLADVIAYSIFRNFEYNDDTYFSLIKDCFDSDGKAIHGLHTLI
jgi:hypothetical protein